jgi:uncharacterized protein
LIKAVALTMLQPHEMKLRLPMEIHNGVISTTTAVWDILVASRNGDLPAVKKMVEGCPELIYAQYNYTPPIHFAVREGHVDLVKYLLSEGAHDPTYRIYPFQESLLTIAQDRECHEITALLENYYSDPSACKYSKDNGAISYHRNELQQRFETSVDDEDIQTVSQILKAHPEFATDETYFWGEGILTMPAKEVNRELVELLMRHGARVPAIVKWAQYYYFEKYEGAVLMMEKGMSANTMSWHHVTLLHDMAQKGYLEKASLLIEHGADVNAVEEEYQSTPLGMAAKWGHAGMVAHLLKHGADPNKSGAPWSTPLVWARKKGHAEIERMLLNAINNTKS